MGCLTPAKESPGGQVLALLRRSVLRLHEPKTQQTKPPQAYRFWPAARAGITPALIGLAAIGALQGSRSCAVTLFPAYTPCGNSILTVVCRSSWSGTQVMPWPVRS